MTDRSSSQDSPESAQAASQGAQVSSQAAAASDAAQASAYAASDAVHLSVIIPAYNEAARIIPTLESAAAYLGKQAYSWEVVVVDDGSADATPAIVGEWAAARAGFRLERIAHAGKGAAVRHGMLAARGARRLMCDADLAMPIEHIADFLARMDDGYDVVIGSRHMAGANRYDESKFRILRAQVFNAVARTLTRLDFADTQCGFKCFSADAARELFSLQRTDGWGFDVELLFLASKRGMRVLEMPIQWHHQEGSAVNPATTWMAILRDVMALRRRWRRGEYAAGVAAGNANGGGVASKADDGAAAGKRAGDKTGVATGKTGAVAVVAPTYNEADNLPTLAERVFGLGIPGIRLIVVDDNSPDGTGDVARAISGRFGNRLELIERESKAGLGTAYIDGFSHAIAQGADYVLQMDADLSHAPEYIPAFLDALRCADVVVGSRYTQGGAVDEGWHFKRHMLSSTANVCIRFVAGLKVKDCTTGFKAFRADALRAIDLDGMRCKGYGFQAEVAYACQRRGYRVVEHPIVFYDRAEGESKLSLGIIAEVLWWLATLHLRKKAYRSL